MTIEDTAEIPQAQSSSDEGDDAGPAVPTPKLKSSKAKDKGKDKKSKKNIAVPEPRDSDEEAAEADGFFDELDDEPLMSRKGLVTTTWHERG